MCKLWRVLERLKLRRHQGSMQRLRSLGNQLARCMDEQGVGQNNGDRRFGTLKSEPKNQRPQKTFLHNNKDRCVDDLTK